MKKRYLILLVATVSFFLIACSSLEALQTSSSAPTIMEELNIDSSADIFLKDELVYKTDIDWVDDLTLTQGKLVGEIHRQASSPQEFDNLTATKLPVGTKIYATNERTDILIVPTNKGKKYYYLLSEG